MLIQNRYNRIMNIEEKKLVSEQQSDLLCVSCKRFYGSQAFGKMCSQCYKKNEGLMTPKKQPKEQKEQIVEKVQEEIKPTEQKKEINKDRCLSCNRKLKLLGIECKCGHFFCNRHRLPEEHECTFNHKNAGKELLSKQVIKVEKGKIETI